jgi:hypothetical protein
MLSLKPTGREITGRKRSQSSDQEGRMSKESTSFFSFLISSSDFGFQRFIPHPGWKPQRKRRWWRFRLQTKSVLVTFFFPDGRCPFAALDDYPPRSTPLLLK